MILSQDLNVIMNWSFPCKMFFNPDLRKQAQEVIFAKMLFAFRSSHKKSLFDIKYLAVKLQK